MADRELDLYPDINLMGIERSVVVRHLAGTTHTMLPTWLSDGVLKMIDPLNGYYYSIGHRFAMFSARLGIPVVFQPLPSPHTYYIPPIVDVDYLPGTPNVSR